MEALFFFMIQIFGKFVRVCFLFAVMLFMGFICATGCKHSCLLWQLGKYSVVQHKKERVMSFWSPVNDFLIFSAAFANPYFSMGPKCFKWRVMLVMLVGHLH